MANPDANTEIVCLPLEAYTVGWICALTVELQASCAMRDKPYYLESQPNTDDNTYVLGKIGPHNVAIVVLPVYGTSAATSAVKSMKSTFPSLRFVLMVGIGGGIPSARHDIRLGDIVVSRPVGQGGGVIQYDMGKDEEDEFVRVGSMNMPPPQLVSASKRLESEPGVGKRISDLAQMAAEKMDEPEEWEYVGAEKDRLFTPKYPHVRGEDDCEKCLQNVKKKDLAQRAVRKRTYPRIFYGNIGSGNSVVKKAFSRDTIAKRENVICFDMESAGLMNEFPCLVIRGISDYADSHKNGNWQPYAAVVAAAYAKLLLLGIPRQSYKTEEISQG